MLATKGRDGPWLMGYNGGHDSIFFLSLPFPCLSFVCLTRTRKIAGAGRRAGGPGAESELDWVVQCNWLMPDETEADAIVN